MSLLLRCRHCLVYSIARAAVGRNKACNLENIIVRGFVSEHVHTKTNVEYNYASQKNQNYNVLYEGHIKLTPFQRILLITGSAAMCLYNPVRDDMISTFGETTGHAALKKVRERMLQDPEGQLILKEKPIVSSETINLKYLDSLPDGTLGKEYWRFLSYNGFDPDGRRPVHFVDDPDLVYIMLRYRQIHDLLHSLMGMPPHMLGEVVIKWIEALQTGLTMCYTAAIFGPLRFGPKHSKLYWNTYMPWAIRCGKQAKFLMSVYFEKHWERNVSDLRKELNIEEPPKSLFMKDKRKEKDDSITE